MNEKLEPRKVISLLFIIAIAVVFTLQFGPGSTGFGATSPGGGPASAASVNGKEISLLQYRDAYARQMERIRGGGYNITPEIARQLNLPRQVLDGLVEQELLAQAAEQHGVTGSDEEIRKILFQNPLFKKEGEFDFDTYRAAVRDYYRKTPQDFEDTLRRELAAEKMLGLVLSGVTVSDDELRARFEQEGNQAKVVFVRFLPALYADKVAAPDAAALAAWKAEHKKDVEKYYEDNRFLYQQPERIKARQILVKMPPEATAEQKAQAKERAEALKKELDGGKDFAAVARESSEDPGTKATGGDLGWVDRGSWEPALADSAFALSDGQVTAPIETRFGYHLVKVEQKQAAQSKELAQVEDEIATTLYKKAKAQEMARAEAEKALAGMKGGKALQELYPPEQKEPALKRFAMETRPEAVETDTFNTSATAVPLLGAAPELLSAVFAAKQAQALEQVYPVGEGFAVAQVTERKVPDAASFEAKKEDLRKQALNTRRGEERAAFLKSLRDSGKVETSAEAVELMAGASS